jgi:hypothetical protein
MFKREEKGRTLSFVLLSSDKSFVRQIIYETQESVMSRGLSLRFLLVMQDNLTEQGRLQKELYLLVSGRFCWLIVSYNEGVEPQI